mgnify:CR=1 FL=1
MMARAMPTKNIGLISKAERIAGLSLQLPSGSPGSIAARGSMNGLPRKNARPMPKMNSAMPTAMSLTRGRLQMAACSNPSALPATPAASMPSQGEPVEITRRKRAHGAEHQGALQTEVHPAAFLGQGLAETHEQIGRGNADRTGDNGEQHAPPAEIEGARHTAPGAAGAVPRKVPLASTQRKISPCNTVVAACGMSKPALKQSTAGRDTTEHQGYQGPLPEHFGAQEKPQECRRSRARQPGIAGGAVHRHDLNGAREPSGCAARKQASRTSRPIGRARHLCRAPIASEYIHRKAERRVAQKQVQRTTDNKADDQTPMHGQVRNIADHEAFRDRPALGLKSAGRSRGSGRSPDG